MVKNLLCRLILATGVVFVTVAGGKSSLTYFGFCFKERRFLSDEEKISIAIRDILTNYPPVIEEYGKTNGQAIVIGGHAPANPIYYKDTDAFLDENPDCCKVTRKMERSGYTIRFEHRLLGSANTFVEVRYKVKYIDASGVERSVVTEKYIAISNCGYPWSGI